MSSRSIDKQVVKFLADVHSVELQALAQLQLAPRIAKGPELIRAFVEHRHQTRAHERLMREALENRGGTPSRLKDLAGRVGGVAMIVFARANPDTPGKLTAHAFSYENLESAAYGLLECAARRANDEQLIELARQIAEEERAMASRLASGFDVAVEASLQEKGADATGQELVSYLRDAHAIEAQSLQLLKAARPLAGAESLTAAFSDHVDVTREHLRLLEGRLQARGSGPSRLQDYALRAGAINLTAFFAAQPDTPIKLAGFAFAFEHLEIAAYELLRRIAERAGDPTTASIAASICGEEREAASRIATTWNDAMDVSLEKVGVALGAGGDPLGAGRA
ncbi:MAG: DUF892 family protein [Solirubrobacterales bacterium]|nr:DUF892 family protein [Solirubrobacterales bacterium]